MWCVLSILGTYIVRATIESIAIDMMGLFILSDRRNQYLACHSNFMSALFQMCTLLGVKKRGTPLHPQLDGMMEEYNHTLKAPA